MPIWYHPPPLCLEPASNSQKEALIFQAPPICIDSSPESRLPPGAPTYLLLPGEIPPAAHDLPVPAGAIAGGYYSHHGYFPIPPGAKPVQADFNLTHGAYTIQIPIGLPPPPSGQLILPGPPPPPSPPPPPPPPPPALYPQALYQPPPAAPPAHNHQHHSPPRTRIIRMIECLQCGFRQDEVSPACPRCGYTSHPSPPPSSEALLRAKIRKELEDEARIRAEETQRLEAEAAAAAEAAAREAEKLAQQQELEYYRAQAEQRRIEEEKKAHDAMMQELERLRAEEAKRLRAAEAERLEKERKEREDAAMELIRQELAKHTAEAAEKARKAEEEKAKKEAEAAAEAQRAAEQAELQRIAYAQQEAERARFDQAHLAAVRAHAEAATRAKHEAAQPPQFIVKAGPPPPPPAIDINRQMIREEVQRCMLENAGSLPDEADVLRRLQMLMREPPRVNDNFSKNPPAPPPHRQMPGGHKHIYGVHFEEVCEDQRCGRCERCHS